MTQGVLFDDVERDDAPQLSEYDAFVEKFKPKKTTDDCYTPANIYDAVADWCAAEYGLDRRTFVRPFYPGGDYEHFAYPDGCIVVDNPPFSILSQIVRFYLYRGIKFFLFAPSLTCFNKDEVCAIVSYCDITYTNGAKPLWLDVAVRLAVGVESVALALDQVVQHSYEVRGLVAGPFDSDRVT